MLELKKLKEKRAEEQEAAKAISDLAKKEARNLSDDEKKLFDDHLKSMDGLDDDIKRAESLDKINKDLAQRNFDKPSSGEKREKEIKKFSFSKLVREAADGKKLTGLEKEMHEEAVTEARAIGKDLVGVGVPSMILSMEKGEKRDHTAGTNSEGGFTVETSLGNLIPSLRNNLQVMKMGAKMMTGLRGNVDIPRQSGITAATWKAENAAADDTSATFDRIQLSPKRLSAKSLVSSQLIAQSNFDVDRLIQDDIMMAVQLALDAAALKGTGTNNQPTGIITTAGVSSVTSASSTNGSTIGWDEVVAMESALTNQNANMNNLGYLVNSATVGKLKTTKKDAGSGIFLLGSDMMLNGYKVGVTNQLSSVVTKGTGTNLSEMVFGNWSDLIIAQWAGLDLVVDPYTKADEGYLKLVVNSFFDTAIRHDQSFSKMTDVITA